MRVLVFRGETIPFGGNLSGRDKGYTYICPTCGDAWARLELGEKGKYFAVTRPCEKHGTSRYWIGGSVLTPFLWWGILSDKPTFLKTLSVELLRFEALRLCDEILKG